MADLAVFGDEDFDVKAYVNAASSSRGPDEPLERFLSELEMRLQLTGEEVEASLTDASTAAIRRVPYAQQEISRLKGDIASLQVCLRSSMKGYPVGVLSSKDLQHLKPSTPPWLDPIVWI